MPRLTRAQMRAQAASPLIHEDPEIASPRSPLQDVHSSQTTDRLPLGELQNPNGTVTAADEQVVGETLPFAENQCKVTKKDNNGSGKNKFNLVLDRNEYILPAVEQEILEDDCPSDSSSAAELAAKELRMESPVRASGDTTMLHAAPSAAAKEANRALNRSPERTSVAVQGTMRTPIFDPSKHTETPRADEATSHLSNSDDSFVVSIRSRTPAHVTNTKEVEGDGPDSFVDDITSRSPSKFVTRIEDSVEALDALDEAIEEASEKLPKAVLEQQADVRTAPKATNFKSSQKKPSLASTGKLKSAKAPLPGRVPSNRPQARPSTLASPRKVSPLAGSAKPQSSSPKEPANAMKRASIAALSTSKPGFVPAKSTKAPTTSSFKLPGEAISAKMKAQRDEKLKKEEFEKKSNEFKARPVPKSMNAGDSVPGKRRVGSIVPRENATTKARMSLMASKKAGEDESPMKRVRPASLRIGNGTSPAKKENSAPRKPLVAAKAPTSSLSVAKTRQSQPGVTISSVKKAGVVSANTSALRQNSGSKHLSPNKPTATSSKTNGRPVTTLINKSRINPGPSLAAKTEPKKLTAAKPTTTSNKGKEVFSRGKIADDELQRLKKVKEDAAKKARADAAERGRLASREWAEKQQLKKKTALNAVGASADIPEKTLTGGAKAEVQT